MMSPRFASLVLGFATLILSACGMPPCAEGDKACEQQMFAPPPNGGGMVTSCTDSSQCLNGQSCSAGKCVANGNPPPNMGGGNVNCEPGEARVFACYEFAPPIVTASLPAASPTWLQITNLYPDPKNPLCVTFCATRKAGWGCVDKHTREIGNDKNRNQTVVDSEIGWCGSNASCQPKYFVVDGKRQDPRAFLGKCGWPFQIVDGWQVPVGTLSIENGNDEGIPNYVTPEELGLTAEDFGHVMPSPRE